MVGSMMSWRNLVCLIGLSSAFAAAPPPPASSLASQTVYLLGMRNGLDQYLATQLTRRHLFTITTDPAQATAVLTDRVGESFEAQLKSLYTPEPPPKSDNAPIRPDQSNIKPPSTFARGRGNVYLVDVKTRRVLWSTHLQPKHTSSDDMDKVASRIVKRLQKETTPKQ